MVGLERQNPKDRGPHAGRERKRERGVKNRRLVEVRGIKERRRVRDRRE